jgi:hypothetical protein
MNETGTGQTGNRASLPGLAGSFGARRTFPIGRTTVPRKVRRRRPRRPAALSLVGLEVVIVVIELVFVGVILIVVFVILFVVEVVFGVEPVEFILIKRVCCHLVLLVWGLVKVLSVDAVEQRFGLAVVIGLRALEAVFDDVLGLVIDPKLGVEVVGWLAVLVLV